MIAALASNPAVLALVGVVADDDDGGESKKSGPIGLAVIIALCIASYFLFKSMSKHLRKVRERAAADAAPVDGTRSSVDAVEADLDRPAPDDPVAELRESEKAPPP
jgi:hypothetical protein